MNACVASRRTVDYHACKRDHHGSQVMSPPSPARPSKAPLPPSAARTKCCCPPTYLPCRPPQPPRPLICTHAHFLCHVIKHARATDQHITFNTDYLSDTLVDFFRCCMCCLAAMMFCRYNGMMIRSVSRSWGRILNTIPNEHDYYVYSALMAPGGNQVRVVLNRFFSNPVSLHDAPV